MRAFQSLIIIWPTINGAWESLTACNVTCSNGANVIVFGAVILGCVVSFMLIEGVPVIVIGFVNMFLI